ncbi:MAG TPA: VOC family protein [Streptosporangiaceae bacterium]
MTHYSRLSVIVIDVPDGDHDRELAFWQEAMGQPLARNGQFPEYHSARLPGGFGLLVQRLGDGPSRVHLDIHTDDEATEVARLERLGAQRLERLRHWQVMKDPAGLVFCVVEDPPGELTEANAHRWD